MKHCLLAVLATCSFGLASTPAQTPDGWDGAFWVWDQPGANKVPQSNEPRYVRRLFTLAGKPAEAELKITADNIYEAYINGHKVGSDGEWSTVEKYDVARHLVPGR